MLTQPMIHYAGCTSSAGVINKSSGYYTCTVNKIGMRTYQISYNVSLASGNYTVICNPRVSTASFCTYSIKAQHVYQFVRLIFSATATDIAFSVNLNESPSSVLCTGRSKLTSNFLLT